MKNTLKIVVAGNYGAENLGDELILSGLLQSLKEASPTESLKITVLSANPLQTAKLHHVNAVKPFPSGLRSFFKSSTATQETVKDCDFFILGGGGLFLSLSFYANFIWTIQAYHAYKLGKKVLMLGQSIGKSKNPLLRYMIKRLFNKATLISVRDNSSKENLENLGTTKEIHMVPDFAFSKSIPGDAFVEGNIGASTRPPYALIALRQMSGLKKSFYSDIAKFITYLRDKKELTVKLVNFQTGHGSDQTIHEKVLEKIKNAKDIEIVPAIKDPSLLIKLFSNTKFALCMRLHSAITAIKCNTPFTAINYADKVPALLKDAGFAKCSINLENLTFEKLKEAYNNSENEKTNRTKIDYSQIAAKELEKFAQTSFHNVLKGGL